MNSAVEFKQSLYVKGNKRWLESSNGQEIIISSQARKVIKFYGINEKKLIEKLKELLLECFSDLEYPFHRISVSKVRIPELSDEYSEAVHLRIDVTEQWSKKKNQRSLKV